MKPRIIGDKDKPIGPPPERNLPWAGLLLAGGLAGAFVAVMTALSR